MLKDKLLRQFDHSSASRSLNKDWKDFKNILCIRPDNLGDILMVQPALRALKEQNISRKITLLTSGAGYEIAKLLPEIDNVIPFDLPWIKTNLNTSSKDLSAIIKNIKKRFFDAAIIFTNFSQNPLPSAFMTYMAQIPRRLAYCRENPYRLLTDWVTDTEPFTKPAHTVKRQLNLVKTIGAETSNDLMHLDIREEAEIRLRKKIAEAGINFSLPFIIVHPGASEKKRRYPQAGFIEAIKLIRKSFDFNIILTGSESEIQLTSEIQKGVSGNRVCSLAGKFALDELIVLIKKAKLLISNNTGPVHIASAVQTPVLVLYANTNFDHFPWKVKSEILLFNPKVKMQSKNSLLLYAVADKKYAQPLPEKILMSVKNLLNL